MMYKSKAKRIRNNLTNVWRETYTNIRNENKQLRAQLVIAMHNRADRVTCAYCAETWEIGKEPINHWETCVYHPAHKQLTAAQAKITNLEIQVQQDGDIISDYESECEQLRMALRPFANAAQVWTPQDSHRILAWCRREYKSPDLQITVGDLLKAQDALAEYLNRTTSEPTPKKINIDRLTRDLLNAQSAIGYDDDHANELLDLIINEVKLLAMHPASKDKSQ